MFFANVLHDPPYNGLFVNFHVFLNFHMEFFLLEFAMLNKHFEVRILNFKGIGVYESRCCCSSKYFASVLNHFFGFGWLIEDIKLVYDQIDVFDDIWIIIEEVFKLFQGTNEKTTRRIFEVSQRFKVINQSNLGLLLEYHIGNTHEYLVLFILLTENEAENLQDRWLSKRTWQLDQHDFVVFEAVQKYLDQRYLLAPYFHTKCLNSLFNLRPKNIVLKAWIINDWLDLFQDTVNVRLVFVLGLFFF